MTLITFQKFQIEQILSHAREAEPAECCGLIAGADDGRVSSIYILDNVATEKFTSYEAAPEDLFAAQRQMRERGEQLLGIYHSHPRSAEAFPSETDVRLAYYPEAVYFIIGLAGAQPIMNAFRISERDEGWKQVEYALADA